MTNKTPEALEVAQTLKERFGNTVPTSQAAALLRRQHQRIEALERALQRIGAIDCSEADKTTAIEMRDISRALSTTQKEDSQA